MENIKNIAPYEVTKIEDNFYVIDEGGVRCFLFVGKDEAFMIDSGFGKGNILLQIREITDLPVTLVMTHADGDHTGCNQYFEKMMICSAEMPYYESHKGPEMKEVILLNDGDKIELGDYKFTVVHIPGHTPGSAAYLEEDRRFLIGGDSIQDGAVFMFGEGRDLDAYIASMKRLNGMRDKFDKIYASHNSLTVGSDIIPEALEAAEKLKAGELEGVKPPMPFDCKVYGYKRAKFLY